MSREPFNFKLFDSVTSFVVNEPFKEISKQPTEPNFFMVENYRYSAIISEHEIILFPKDGATRIQVKRYSDGSVKTSTISDSWNGSLSLNRTLNESIFDKYLKDSILKAIIEDAKKRNSLLLE